MKSYIYLLLVLLSVELAFSQTASVQFFHNVPTLGTEQGPVFDVYVNGTLNTQLTGIEFREATNFLPIPANFNIVIDIRQSPSTIMDTPLRTFFLEGFEDGKVYTAMISGILDDIGFLPDLAIDINDGAFNASINEQASFINMAHGGILLPEMKIGIKDGSDLFEADYGEFSNYMLINSVKQFITVEVEGLDFPLTYELDLEEREGDSGTIFVSGSAINAPEWGVFIAYADGSVEMIPLTPVGYVQFVNLSKDTLVDIYVNNELLLDSLEVCEASPYIFIPAEEIIDIGIASAGSESSDDVYEVFNIGFESDKFHQCFLTGESENLDFPLNIDTNRDVPEEVSADSVSFNVINAIPSSDTLLLFQKEMGHIIDTMVYDTIYGYFNREEGEYYLDILSFGVNQLLESYILTIPDSLLGTSFTLALIEKDNNYIMTLISAEGESQTLEILPYSEVQIINNSPNTDYDLYRNTEKIVDSLSYLSATSFLRLPAGIDQALYLVPAGSDTILDFVHIHPYILDEDSTYIFMLNGSMASEAEYEFEVIENNMARSASNDFNATDFHFFQGIYDSLTVSAFLIGEGDVLEELTFGHFSMYDTKTSDIYFIDVDYQNEDTLSLTYQLDMSEFGGRGVTLMFHGSIEDSSAVQLSLIDTTGQFYPLGLSSISRTQIIHAVPNATVDIYLDSTLYLESFEYQNATPYINLEADSSYHFYFTLAGAGSIDSAFYDIVFNPEGGKEYVLVAAGIIDNEERPFEVFINSDAQSTAPAQNQSNLSVFHGNANGTGINIAELNGSNLFGNLEYGAFSNYSLFSGINDFWTVNEMGNENIVGVFEAFLSDLSPSSSIVLYTNSSDTLELWAVRANGNIVNFPLINVARGQFIQNSPLGALDVYLDRKPILLDFDFREASEFIYLPTSDLSKISFAAAGTDFEFAEFDYILEPDSSYIFFITGLTGNVDYPFDLLLVESIAEENTISSDSLLINFIHGSSLHPLVNINSEQPEFNYSNAAYSQSFVSNLVNASANILTLVDQANDTIVDRYYADFRDLEGESGTLWLSGFDELSSPESLLFAFNDGRVVEIPKVGLANLQVVNNSTVPLNDMIIDDNERQTDLSPLFASPYLTIPTGLELELLFDFEGVEDIILNQSFDSDQSYIIILQQEGSNDSVEITPIVLDSIRTESIFENRVDLTIYNGTPFTGPINIGFRNISQLVSDLQFKDQTDYFQLVAQSFVLDTEYSIDDMDTLITHLLDIDTLSGQSCLLLSSSFMTENEVTSWYIIRTDGEVISLNSASISRIQFLNNTLAGQLDILNGDQVLFNGIDTRQASGYLSLNTIEDESLNVQRITAQGDTVTLFNQEINFRNKSDYIVIFNTEGDSDTSEVSIHIIEDAIISTDPFTEFNTIVHHGAPIDHSISLEDGDGFVLADQLAQGSSTDYTLLTPAEYQLSLRVNASDTIETLYGGDLRLLGGQSLVIFTSGRIEGADPLGLYGLLPNGVVFPFEILVSNRHELGIEAIDINVFPVPAGDLLYLDIESLNADQDYTIDIIDAKGRLQKSVKTSFNNNQQVILDIHHLIPGFYVLKISTNKGYETVPFVKQ